MRASSLSVDTEQNPAGAHGVFTVEAIED